MVPFLNKTMRPLMLAIVLAGSLLTLPGTALAKPKGGLNDKILEEDTSKSYTLPYALVVLGIALGVMIVARPGTRLEEAKLRAIDDDDE
jgi:hypothetical protein